MTEPDGKQAPRRAGLAREALLARSFVRLADTLVKDFDIVEFLHGLAVDSAEILGAEAAGVMLADQRSGLRLVTSSQERMRHLELLELKTVQGPCLDAFASGQAVQASAADSLSRWPAFAPQASEAGFQRLCGVPLQVRAEVIGVLNLFRDGDEPFIVDEMEIARAMAEMAAIALSQEQELRDGSALAEQLQGALGSRIVIEQAKGMLAGHFTIPMDNTFPLLRKYARSRNRKIAEVAADIVSGKITGQDLITPARPVTLPSLDGGTSGSTDGAEGARCPDGLMEAPRPEENSEPVEPRSRARSRGSWTL